jgi:RNA polymerase sigma-B factor
MGGIKREVRDRTWAVRVPRDLQELARRVDRVIADLTRELGRAPTVDEVALAGDTECEDILEAMQASSAYRATSLETPRACGDNEPGDTLGDSVGRVDDGLNGAEQRAVLSRARPRGPYACRSKTAPRTSGSAWPASSTSPPSHSYARRSTPMHAAVRR